MRAAFALLAVLDPNADEDQRVNGALLIGAALRDIAIIRSVFVTLDGERKL